MIWTFIGFILGYALGKSYTPDYPKDLEHATEQIKRTNEHLVYYKKLTKKLVDENTELRNKINAS
jgi:hypothetical protein